MEFQTIKLYRGYKIDGEFSVAATLGRGHAFRAVVEEQEADPLPNAWAAGSETDEECDRRRAARYAAMATLTTLEADVRPGWISIAMTFTEPDGETTWEKTLVHQGPYQAL